MTHTPSFDIQAMIAALPAQSGLSALREAFFGPYRPPRRALLPNRFLLEAHPELADAWLEVGTALLRCAAHEPEPSLRMNLIHHVSYVPHRSLAGALAAFVSPSEDPLVRVEALQVLAECGGEVALTSLRAAVADADDAVRACACAGHGRLVPWLEHHDIVTLAGILDTDSSPDVRSWAAISLGELSGAFDAAWPPLRRALDTLAPEAPHAGGLSVALGAAIEARPDYLDAALDALDSPLAHIRRCTAEAIGHVPPAVVPPNRSWRLRKTLVLLTEPGEAAYLPAAWALARHGDSSGRSALVVARESGGRTGLEAAAYLALL